MCCFVFFFNDTATTEIYTLSLHDALPISLAQLPGYAVAAWLIEAWGRRPTLATFLLGSAVGAALFASRSGEHTSEIHSPPYLVFRLLLGKKITYVNAPHNCLLQKHYDKVI